MSNSRLPGIRFALHGLALILSAAIAVPQAAIAAEAVGAAKRIQNVVTGSSGNRRLAVADPVFASESISAAANSFGEIELTDGAKVLVGENSQVALDDFVVSSSDFRSASIRVTKGAFRLISGNSRKGAFKLHTPLADIGVRGTIFDIYVRDGGVTDVVLLNGQLNVCARGGGCAVVERPCDVVRVNRGGVTREPFLRSPERSATDEWNLFPLLRTQAQISSAFRAPIVACNDRSARAVRDAAPAGGSATNGPNDGDYGSYD